MTLREENNNNEIRRRTKGKKATKGKVDGNNNNMSVLIRNDEPAVLAEEEIMAAAQDEANENTPLLLTSPRAMVKGFTSEKERKKTFIKRLVSAFILALIGNVLVVYFVYFHNSVKIRILSFNVWGMPGGLGGCKDKDQRIAEMAKVVAKGEFELILLQELWMQNDHAKIEAALPNGYHITGFRQLASWSCDGRVLVTSCSGLAIISAFPIKSVDFKVYEYRGTVWDFEWFAGKGVGRVRVEPAAGLEVDVFTTHTIADSDAAANNTWYREKQVEELIHSHISKSKAHAIILGGDFNTSPTSAVYSMVKNAGLLNSVQDLFTEWLEAHFATYANIKNTYTGHLGNPITLDYVFHRANHDLTTIQTNWFWLPYLTGRIFTKDKKEEVVSLSDHEAVAATLYLRRWSDKWPYL